MESLLLPYPRLPEAADWKDGGRFEDPVAVPEPWLDLRYWDPQEPVC